MTLQTRLIGTRIPVPLYLQLEAYAGSSKTIGEVFRTALEYFIKHMHTVSTKPAVNRSNTSNTASSIGDLARRLQSTKSDRSDNFEV